MAKEKLQRILDSIWVADLWGWSPWQCLVGLPHSQKPTSCVGVRQTDWNSPQSAALPSLTRRGWTSSDYFMRWKEKAALTSIRLLCTLFFFYWLVDALICGMKESEIHAEEKRKTDCFLKTCKVLISFQRKCLNTQYCRIDKTKQRSPLLIGRMWQPGNSFTWNFNFAMKIFWYSVSEEIHSHREFSF